MLFSDVDELSQVFHSNNFVGGLTHSFYRYPARFNPKFVRHIIKELTEPGDLILDPFMGGGTVVVEALALGRSAMGVDINNLSEFITRVKTTPLSPQDINEITEWPAKLPRNLFIAGHGNSRISDQTWRNLPSSLQIFFAGALQLIHTLKLPRRQRFIRCALLRIGQNILEGVEPIPTQIELCLILKHEIQGMIESLDQFVQASTASGLNKQKITESRTLLSSSFASKAVQRAIKKVGSPPKLLITSPPYPGVHVLYHRWQVNGRRETPAPYWIGGVHDGHKPSYYTMGSRSRSGIRNYFEVLRHGFENLRPVLTKDTKVVQLVGFSDWGSQLPMFLESMTAAGYERLPAFDVLSDQTQIRTVPHRKWYTNRSSMHDASHEVLMIHRPLFGGSYSDPNGQ